MIEPIHEIALASAGTGKTHRLVRRLIRLLAAPGAASVPERVLATTFTRSAAGEIRDRLLSTLAEAGLADEAFARLSADVPEFGGDRRRCLEVLATLARSLHRLNIGTIDSFFMRLARSFALEIDLPPGWRIAEPDEAPVLRAEAIASIVAEARVDDLVASVRQLSRRSDSAEVATELERALLRAYVLVRTSDESAWTWIPRPRPLSDDVLAAAIEALRAEGVKAAGDASKSILNRISRDVDSAGGSDWKAVLGKGLGRCLHEGTPTYAGGGKNIISDDLRQLYQPIVEHARAVLLGRLANRTERTRRIVERLHGALRQVRRRTRAFGFDDVAFHLAAGTVLDRLDEMYFRLDARIDHVLLDEFQDTSILQWRVLEPLAEELVSDGTGARSFFCVGDVKQSLYGFRGGCPDLLQRLPERMPQASLYPMDLSWRAAPPVIEAVNAVFGNLAHNPALDPDAHRQGVEAWSADFRLHRTVHESMPGFVELRAARRPRAGERTQAEATLADAADIVRGVHAAVPSASIGVLVRQNNHGQIARLIHALKRGDPAVLASEEGGSPLTDAPSVTVILSLLRLADHPGDGIATFHVARSPLGEALGVSEEGGDGVASRVRRDLLHRGFGACIADWAQVLAPSAGSHDRRRLGQLVELAAGAENRASLRPSDFVALVEGHRVVDSGGSPVRVMTIHGAKGLEFDVVVLPDLESGLVKTDPDGMLTRRDHPLRDPDRICTYVSADFAPALPELEVMHAQRLEQAVRDSLSVLYVAMTRARHALHMLVAPTRGGVASPGHRKTFAGLLCGALRPEPRIEPGDVLWTAPGGEIDWHERVPGRRDPGERTVVEHASVRLGRAGPGPRRGGRVATPSGDEDGGRVRLAGLLDREAAPAMLRGTVFHAWFQHITWLDDEAPDRATLRTQVLDLACPGEDLERWMDDFLEVLDRPALSTLLRRPGTTDDLEVRVELPFAARFESEGVADEGPVDMHGAIDRLVITRRDGVVVGLEVIDFKSDGVADTGDLRRLVDRYRPQVEAYRRAARALFDRGGAAPVTVRLAFTATDAVVEVAELAATAS